MTESNTPQSEGEKTPSGSHLRRERRRADETIKDERARADLAATAKGENQVKERQLVAEERGKTDRDLARERRQTDHDIEQSARLLADEQTAHDETRTQLTSRDEFLAIVSHDLRNPLGMIASAAEVILQDASPDEAKQYAEMIKRNADVALRLISDLLDMERISVGKLDVHLAQHNVTELVADSAKALKHAAEAKAIALQLDAAGDPVFAYCDADRILQVLSNLIGNAIKFAPEGGHVTLRVDERESEVQVSVSDNGPGIPEDKVPIIFERFSQLHKQDRRGLGLGLFIAREIIAAHHGRLWVESKVGQGSTFSFTLPATV